MLGNVDTRSFTLQLFYFYQPSLWAWYESKNEHVLNLSKEDQLSGSLNVWVNGWFQETEFFTRLPNYYIRLFNHFAPLTSLSVKCVRHVMLLNLSTVLSVTAVGLQFRVDLTADERGVLCELFLKVLLKHWATKCVRSVPLLPSVTPQNAVVPTICSVKWLQVCCTS